MFWEALGANWGMAPVSVSAAAAAAQRSSFFIIMRIFPVLELSKDAFFLLYPRMRRISRSFAIFPGFHKKRPAPLDFFAAREYIRGKCS